MKHIFSLDNYLDLDEYMDTAKTFLDNYNNNVSTKEILNSDEL